MTNASVLFRASLETGLSGPHRVSEEGIQMGEWALHQRYVISFHLASVIQEVNTEKKGVRLGTPACGTEPTCSHFKTTAHQCSWVWY